MQLHVRSAIADVGTVAANDATCFRRLAQRKKNQQCGRETFHRKTWPPATCTCSELNNTTTRNTNPPNSTRIDAVATL